MGKLFESKCESILSEDIDRSEIQEYLKAMNEAHSLIEEAYTSFGHGHNPEWIKEAIEDMDPDNDPYRETFQSDFENAKKDWAKVKPVFFKMLKAQDAVWEAYEALKTLESLSSMQVAQNKKSAYLGVGR